MTTATLDAPAPVAAPTADGRAPDLRYLPLDQLRESPFNTRTHFDPTKLAELAASMKASGQLEPALARPVAAKGKTPGHYELAAGHRRFRAAKLAGLDALLVLVREMDDRTFLEVLSIDNLQREDVHPLEEAQGYKNLLTIDGYNHKLIAARVGKTDQYVYDRLKLLALIPAAKKLFLDNRFTIGHAVLLSRIPADTQKQLVEDVGGVGGLWRRDFGHATLGFDFPDHHDDDDDKEHRDYNGAQPVSVRQLQQWIDEHVRFDAASKDTPQLFPETAENVKLATMRKERIIPITYDYHVQPEAKDKDGERTYGPSSWKRADGKPHKTVHGDDDTASKTCEYSVLGVVAAGEFRGESFRVCVEKKKCTTHWGKEIKERNARARERQNAPARDDQFAADQAKREAAEQARAAEAERYEKAMPVILTEIAKQLAKASAGAQSAVAKFLWEEFENGLWGLDANSKRAAEYLPRGTTADDFVRHVALCAVIAASDRADDFEGALAALKLKVDIEAIVDRVAPKATAAPEPEPKAKPKKAKKK